MAKLRFVYKNPTLGEIVLAEGEIGEKIIEADGNYYVDKSLMQNLDKLQIDKEAYTCPYKGKCDYLDLYNEEGVLVKKMVTWTYPNPNPGWEMIDDRYGFPKISGMNDIDIIELTS